MTEPLVWSRERIAQALGCSPRKFDRTFRHMRGFPKQIDAPGFPMWYSKAIIEWLEQWRETV